MFGFRARLLDLGRQPRLALGTRPRDRSLDLYVSIDLDTGTLGLTRLHRFRFYRPAGIFDRRVASNVSVSLDPRELRLRVSAHPRYLGRLLNLDPRELRLRVRAPALPRPLLILRVPYALDLRLHRLQGRGIRRLADLGNGAFQPGRRLAFESCEVGCALLRGLGRRARNRARFTLRYLRFHPGDLAGQELIGLCSDLFEFGLQAEFNLRLDERDVCGTEISFSRVHIASAKSKCRAVALRRERHDPTVAVRSIHYVTDPEDGAEGYLGRTA